MLNKDFVSALSIQQPVKTEAGQTATGCDPFDVTRLRLSQDFLTAAGVKKVLNTIPVRKPSKEWFIRTHPDPEYRLHTYVIELKEDAEVYLVSPSLWQELVSESCFGPRALITTINCQNVVTLWPIRLPGADGKIDDWNRSALEASTLAAEKWIMVQANKSLGAYEVYEAAVGVSRRGTCRPSKKSSASPLRIGSSTTWPIRC